MPACSRDVRSSRNGDCRWAKALMTQSRPAFPAPKGPEDRPTVGDWLLIDRDSRNLVRILDRTSLFKRTAPGDDRRLQLIAANVDTLFVVTSCNQDFNVARIERYLVLAREVGVRPVIVLTKADLSPTPGNSSKQRVRSRRGCRSSWSTGATPRVSFGSLPTVELEKRLHWWDHRVSVSPLSSTR